MSWVINNSVAGAKNQSSLLRLRAQNESPQIQKVLNAYAKRVAIIALQVREPIGINVLTTLAN